MPWIAEGTTWGACANTSPHNRAHLDITSSFFSLHFPQERGGRRGGKPNGKHVSSTFQLQLPACPLPSLPLAPPPACANVQPCPWCCHLWPSCTPIWPPRPDDQSFCVMDLSPLFTLYLFLSLALGSPQPGRQRARGEAFYKHKIKRLPVPMLLQEPCMSWCQALLPSGLIPYLYNGLISKGLISSVFLARQQWLPISRAPFP